MSDDEPVYDDPEGLEEDTLPPDEADGEAVASVRVHAGAQQDEDDEMGLEGAGVELLTFDFVEYFLEITEELMRHPAARSVRRDVDQPTPHVTIHAIEDGLGGALAPELKSLYLLGDSFRFSFEIGSDGVGGALELLPFTRVFGRWVDELWVDRPEDTQQQNDLRWSLRGFDFPEHPGALDVVLEVDPDDPARHALWVHHPEHDPLPIDLGLVDYLYCALGARGLHRWQLLFTPYDHHEDPWGLGDTLGWLDQLALHFPDADRAFFLAQRDGHALNE